MSAIAAKPGKAYTSSVSVRDLPAIPKPSSALATNVDFLYDEAESCHIVKKIRFIDGSGEATKRDVVDAIAREHRVLNAAFPPEVAYSDSEPSWFTKRIEGLKSTIKKQGARIEDLTSMVKKQGARIEDLKSTIKKQRTEQRVHNYNAYAVKRNRQLGEEHFILLLNKQGKKPTRGPKTKKALQALDKDAIMDLEEFYDVDFKLKESATPGDWRSALKDFLMQGPIPPSEVDDESGEEDDADSDEGSQDDDDEDDNAEDEGVYEDIPNPPKKTTRKQVGKVDDDE